MSTALCLAGYGLLVALVTPGWLNRIAGTGRAPRLGVAAWLLALGTVVGSMLAAVAALIRTADVAVAATGWAALVGVLARAGWAGTVTWRDGRANRMAHEQLVAILGTPDPRLGVVIVDAPEPMVYCLAAPSPTIVVTTGARQALSRRQLSAALDHERAHLAGRHHLLLAFARAAGRAIPSLALFASAAPALAGLLEMRADDAAARRHGRRTVAAAIAAMGGRTAPLGTLGASGPSALARGLRLCRAEPTWRAWTGRAVLTLTVGLLAAGPYLSAVQPLCPHPWW